MAKAKKKAAKKRASTKRTKRAAKGGLPEGYRSIGGFAESWQPKKVGDTIEGEVTAKREVPRKKAKKGQKKTMLCITVESEQGPLTVWESAGLLPLLTEVEMGDVVYIEFLGMGKKKAGQNAPRLYRTGIAE